MICEANDCSIWCINIKSTFTQLINIRTHWRKLLITILKRCLRLFVCTLILMPIRRLMCLSTDVRQSAQRCVFVNVVYNSPFIIVGLIHMWHLPLTSALRQALLLKGQNLQLMSITSSLLSLLCPLLSPQTHCWCCSEVKREEKKGESS